MSGVPTQAEIEDQWTKGTRVLEQTRNHGDGTLAGAAGSFDDLIQALEGEYTPGLAEVVGRFRAGMSDLASPGLAADFLEPIFREYAAHVLTDLNGSEELGNVYTPGTIMHAMYHHFADAPRTVESRAITFDTTATTSDGHGGAVVGNGALTRLTKDENNHDMEACHVETKRWRCIRDQNSGVKENAEEFECLGDASSRDDMLRANFGSGELSRVQVRSKHAGSGDGGSLLKNSSFSSFNAASTPKFVGWAQSFGGAAVAGDITQDVGNFYRSFPSAGTDASLSLAMNGAGDTITLKQTLANMRATELDPETPYFLRVMWNGTVGAAVGGTINLRLGSQTVSVAVAQTGWQELFIPANNNTWFRNFNQDGFDVELELTGTTAGSVLFDDMIFAPYTFVDGTYWVIRGNAATHTPWKRDDTLAFTDTGGAPATAKIQWWLFIAGLGYLPHTTGVPNVNEPAA